jgi:hypothetical protein
MSHRRFLSGAEARVTRIASAAWDQTRDSMTIAAQDSAASRTASPGPPSKKGRDRRRALGLIATNTLGELNNVSEANAANIATQVITVKVSFPVSEKSPYRAMETPDTTAGAVREAAMRDFAVSDSNQYTYVLTHDGKKVPDSEAIGQIAGDRHSVEFRLVKELTQG